MIERPLSVQRMILLNPLIQQLIRMGTGSSLSMGLGIRISAGTRSRYGGLLETVGAIQLTFLK